MAATPLRILLFAVGAIVAAAGTAYFAGALDPWLGTTQQVVAGLPEGSEEDAGKSGRLEPSGGAEVPAAEEDEAAATAKGDRVSKSDGDEQGATDVVVPTFDVVRVEPDGSLVIAGNAAPNANVEVVAGSTVVGAAASGPAGDFAVVLDDPLDPGDYQIVLRATSPDGVVATSEETAVVSIPDEESGQVLALVEQPGEPSRLITVPEADPAGEQSAAETAQDQAVEQSQEQAGEEEVAVADASGEASTSDREAAATSKGEKETPSDGAEAEPAGETAATQAPASGTEQMADAKTQDTGAEEGSAEVATAGDSPAAETETGDAASGQASASKDATADEERQMAAVAPEEPGNETQAAAPEAGNVFIEAVEIDGNQVFVAGVAEAGRRVLVYANDMLLGQAVASPGGRFLVEAIRDLPVGDYIIRADVLADNGSDVLARAAVPFEREAGEAVAAVAPRPDEAETPAESGETAGQAPEPAPTGEESAEAETEMASTEESSQAQSEDGSAARSTEEKAATPAEEPGDEVARAGEEAPASDENRKADAEETPNPADGTAMADISEDDASGGEDMAASQESDASMPDGSAQAAGEAGSTMAGDAGKAEESDEAGSMAASEAAETMQPGSGGAQSDDGTAVVTAPKLEPADGAVIIRRGDTLWHISRRVYGRGIRYTTIYLANDDQIRDPDWIWPGQVFRVPEKTEAGETAEMEALGDQLVPVPQEQ